MHSYNIHIYIFYSKHSLRIIQKKSHISTLLQKLLFSITFSLQRYLHAHKTFNFTCHYRSNPTGKRGVNRSNCHREPSFITRGQWGLLSDLPLFAFQDMSGGNVTAAGKEDKHTERRSMNVTHCYRLRSFAKTKWMCMDMCL